ncbi:MAG: hypothetical protein GX879_01015, partial [Bacteroidales bacterium]|nr:hypothetical protein [Bacteroidales bacterium]
HYAYQIPEGDLAEKYGQNSMVGLGVTFKTKFNLMIGGEISYLFGNTIKRDSTILDGLRSSNGEIINEYGEYAKIICSQRGFYTGINLGYLIPIGKPNKNSGIVLKVGSGLLQHHIRIENKDNNAPQVLGDYKKGYDRLTNGLANKYFIGYQHLSNNKWLNFSCGFEFYQAWTKNRRDFNFDTMSRDETLYHEYLYSIRAAWILPVYYRSPDKFYYY